MLRIAESFWWLAVFAGLGYVYYRKDGQNSLSVGVRQAERRRFRIPFDVTGKKWVRFAVWDSAGNGAFTQPVHLT